MWQIKGSIAELSTDHFTGLIDLSRPWMGFTLSNERPAGILQILGVWFKNHNSEFESQQSAVHVRATDLVARYTEDQLRNVYPEIYWRLIEPTSLGVSGIELIASVQTSMLSSKPRLTTLSRCIAKEVLRIEARRNGDRQKIDFDVEKMGRIERDNFLLIRPNNTSFSYCEMVHPSDFVSSTITQTEQQDIAQLSHELFPQSLEKGVIRRGRVRGIFVPRERDVECAREHFLEFADSKPVLSA
jgi:hypothetical protein